MPTETERLNTLHALQILDTPRERSFDGITRIVSELLQVPIALISLVDDQRQWFKSSQGLVGRETPRCWSFCSHAIQNRTPLIVPDANADVRFVSNPMVTGDPQIRFYAGAPIYAANGNALGALCAIDSKARDGLSSLQLKNLLDLAEITSELIASRYPSPQQRGDD